MEKNKRFNPGINILRMWMALEVILLHRMSWKGYEGPFYSFLKACELFSVPIFMIISFYLNAETIEENDKEKLKKRLIRLFIPQAGWAVLCWITYFLTDIIFMHELSHDLNDLIIAIIFGCRNNTNPSTWFQCVLILLTLLFALIYSFSDKRISRVVTFALFFVSICIQASGTYYDLFQKMPYEICNTLGRIFEVMPYACIGMFLKQIDILKIFKTKRAFIMILSVILFFVGFSIPFPHFKGFFEGPYPIYMSVLLFLFFLFLPFEKTEDGIRKGIAVISRYTLGIYCAHRLVYGIMEIVYELIGLAPGNFMKCLLVYVICYMMSFVMSRMPVKVLKMMVE